VEKKEKSVEGATNEVAQRSKRVRKPNLRVYGPEWCYE
jgi:hypothetical protein